MVVPLADQHHAHGAAGAPGLGGLVEVAGVDPRHQHVVAAAGQRVGQAAQQGQEKRVGQVLPRLGVVRHDHRHRAVLLQPQVLRADVDAVVQRPASSAMRSRVLGIDQRAVGQGPRHGGDRHPRQPGDVGHLHAAGRGAGGSWRLAVERVRGGRAIGSGCWLAKGDGHDARGGGGSAPGHGACCAACVGHAAGSLACCIIGSQAPPLATGPAR